MSDSHDDIRELLGAYALDAVDPQERELVEAHLPDCPRCTAEVAEHREVAAMLAHTGAPAPEGLWSRIQESLEETPPSLSLPVPGSSTEASDVAHLDAARGRSSRHALRRWMPVLAAAVVVVVGLVVGVVVTDDGPSVVERPVAAPTLEEVARRAFNDPQARTATLSADSGDLNVPVAIRDDGTGYLLATALPSLDDRHTYQLWGITGDVVISLGVLGPSPEVVAFSTDRSVEALAITREVAGGVVSSENPPLLVGEVS